MTDLIAIPFGYVLRAIYTFVGSYGLSIILFTIFTKLILYPLMFKSKKSMRGMQKLQPKQLEIQKKYKNNKAKQQEEMAKLYQESGTNPAGGCLPMLLTFPIILGLYGVIQRPLSFIMGLSVEEIIAVGDKLGVVVTEATLRTQEITLAGDIFHNYEAVASISDKIMPIDFNFLGFNLAETPSLTNFSILLLIPIISMITSYASMMITQKLQGTSMEGQPQSMKMMLYMMPVFSGYIGTILPAGVSLYWIVGNLSTIVQEYIMVNQLKRIEAKEEQDELTIKNREAENKRREAEFKKEEQRRLAKEQNNKKLK